LVICSPRSAQSKWVNQEIADFKALGRANHILAAIVDGEPNSGESSTECFPSALKYQVDAGGKITNKPERFIPIAADFRQHGDGFSNGIMKLAAGMLDVGFDELKQRHRADEFKRRSEPPRVCRRLPFLREWSNEQAKDKTPLFA
jgi:hypothetical protein